MRAIIRRFDRFLRQANRVFEFSQDAQCLLRIQLTKAPHQVTLDRQTIAKGEPVLMLHLWNEHIPPAPPGGFNVSWAIQTKRMLAHSFKELAHAMQNDPHLAKAKAVGGVTPLITFGEPSGSTYLMQRLGFTIFPSHNPLGRFGEFWENLYAWGLMWTYNAASLKWKNLFQLRRSEIWMSAEDFLTKYGGRQEHQYPE